MTGAEFGDRVRAVHRRHTGIETGYGAWAWFGSHCDGRTGRQVYEWSTMPQVPRGPHMVVLAMLEVFKPGSACLKRVLTALAQTRSTEGDP